MVGDDLGLLGNYTVLHKSCAQFTNGTSVAGAYAGVTPSNYQKNGLYVNRFANYYKFSSVPIGYRPPYCFGMPLQDGGIASLTLAVMTSDGTANLAGGRNLIATSAFTLTLSNAQLDQIVSGICNGTLTFAKVDAILAGSAGAIASSTFTLSLVQALLGAKVSSVANGTLILSGSTELTALAFLDADGGGPQELTPQALANAVLDALLADHNIAGSVGEALNNIGASSNPWSSLLSANNDPGSFGERIQKLLTETKYIGLK